MRRTGFKIDEEWVGSLLLAGLPERFAPMIMAVEHSGIKVTTESIKTKLLDMQKDGVGEQNGAFVARKKPHFTKKFTDGDRNKLAGKTADKKKDRNTYCRLL